MAFLAIFLRLLIPQGTMLSPSAGGVVMTLCSGVADSESQLVVDPGHDKQPGAAHEQPCDFGVASAPALASVTAAMAAPFVIAARVATLPAIMVAVGRGLAAPPPPSTGPPAIA